VITRIEIDGFKSFVDFSLDVPSFLVVMGGNASGKSNLVDALRSLSDAARGADSFRIGATGSRGIPAELFHQFEDGTRAGGLRIAVDCRTVRMDGSQFDWKAERLVRYEASASRIDADGLRFHPLGSEAVLSDSAVVAELDSWVPLSFVPQLMRERGLVTDDRRLQADGSNVAAVLGRIADAGDPDWLEFLADAVALLPELRDVRVVRSREYRDLELQSRGNGWMSSRTASDGTLRVLGILAAMHDPLGPSVVILDEVENGLHPARLAELIRRLRAITYASQTRGPARQLILTTHSPVVLSALYPEHATDIVFLSTAYGPRVVDGRKVGSMRTVATPTEGASLPRALARYVLNTVKPLEPR
jgi:energy-coupling factor transporter ATP-binding protein EcfA2